MSITDATRRTASAVEGRAKVITAKVTDDAMLEVDGRIDLATTRLDALEGQMEAAMESISGLREPIGAAADLLPEGMEERTQDLVQQVLLDLRQAADHIALARTNLLPESP